MKVHLGCGSDIRPGWLNIDVQERNIPDLYLRWDLATGLPPQLQAVDLFYSSHFWEHLSDRVGRKLLSECLNCLVPGGCFRMALPDFRAACDAYIRGDWSFFDLCAWETFSPPETRALIDVVSWTCYQFGEHQSIWDADKAMRVLSQVGFCDIRLDTFRLGLDPDSPLRRRHSFYIEALRPKSLRDG